jgi:hypothetical protein
MPPRTDLHYSKLSFPRALTVLAIQLAQLFFGSLACADTGANWCVFLPGQVSNEFYVPFVGSMSHKTVQEAAAIRLPKLLREGAHDLVPLPIEGRWLNMSDGRTLIQPSLRGLVAIQSDSIWSERQSDDASAVHVVPQVVVVDTLGSEMIRFLNARNPSWSPNGTTLALALVRRPMGPKIWGRTTEYPETPDSVVLWDAVSGSRRTFPIAAKDVGWVHSDELIMNTGDVVCRLNLSSGEVLLGHQPGGVQLSPDGQYSASAVEPSPLRVWKTYPRTELTGEILHEVGGGVFQDRPLPFWIGRGNGHVLCVGVSTKRAGPPYKKPVWRTAFVDVGRMKVVRVLDARLVAPIADQSGAVVRRGDRFEFVRLGD